jgi:hypothetical protein
VECTCKRVNAPVNKSQSEKNRNDRVSEDYISDFISVITVSVILMHLSRKAERAEVTMSVMAVTDSDVFCPGGHLRRKQAITDMTVAQLSLIWPPLTERGGYLRREQGYEVRRRWP